MKRILISLFTITLLFSCSKDDTSPVKEVVTVVINEIYTNGNATQSDWVELYNKSDKDINIGGYKIFGSGGQIGSIPKMQIPSSSVIPANGFRVFNTENATSSSFNLSHNGDALWLEDASGTIIDQLIFPALSFSQSFGRYPDGSSNWEVLNSLTRGVSNTKREDASISVVPVFRLPSVLIESSGIAITSPGKIWSHNDSGNENKLYCFNTSGALLRTLTISNVFNNDWEDLTVDSQKRIYINDAGNNDNNRTNLAIYRIPDPETITGNSVAAEIIKFSFEDQVSYPPATDKRNFDIEAIIWKSDSLFMFTKDRSTPLTGITKLYKIPATPGTHVAKLAGSLYIGSTTISGRITSADIDLVTGEIVLLINDKLLFFKNYPANRFFEGQKNTFSFKTIPGQVEAITYVTGNKLYMTEEGVSGDMGYFYEISITGK